MVSIFIYLFIVCNIKIVQNNNNMFILVNF